MRPVLAISIALLLFTTSLKDILHMCAFRLNQAYIAKTLCVSKDVTNNHCQGKCFLLRSIQEERQNESKGTVPAKDENRNSLFYILNVKELSVTLAYNLREPFYYRVKGKLIAYLPSIFNPPRHKYS